MAILAVDYGKVRVGLALSDTSNTIASPLKVIEVRSPRDGARQISELLQELNVDLIVVGLPLLLTGHEGEAAESARKLAFELGKRTKIKIVFFDERFSSASAESTMKEDGLDERKRRGKVDKIAATIILQSYLDNKKQNLQNDKY